jgi:hypothetical protein
MIWFLVVGDNRRASISGKTAPASNSNLNWCKGYVAGHFWLELDMGKYNTWSRADIRLSQGEC